MYEASARALVVLDADGWKYHFNVKNTHRYAAHPYTWYTVIAE